jgi:alpha-1,2-mannosyltransferase
MGVTMSADPGAVLLSRTAWRARPTLAVLSLVMVAAAVVQLARLGSFMLDAQKPERSMLPLYETFVRHSCLSAYYRAAELARAGEADLYRPELYRGKLASFHQEIYQYPPPFLLLPGALAPVAGHDFLRLRALWFAVLVVPLLAALVLTARFVGGASGCTMALLAPAVLASLPTLLGLQYGNFHLAAVALSVLSLFGLRAGGRGWGHRLGVPVGAAVLAFVAWAKIFPVLLLVPLVVERRWRAVAWTAAWGAVWLLLAAVVLGPAPIRAFFDHQLGHVASGAAFPYLAENDRIISANLSAYAVALKLLTLIGVTPGPSLAGALSAGYAVALVVGLAAAAVRQRRAGDDRLAAMRLAVTALFLGALISPFAPQPYAGFAGLWLLTLLVPGAGPRRGPVLALAWLALAVMVHALPLHAGPTMLLLSLLGQLLALAPAVWVLAAPTTWAGGGSPRAVTGSGPPDR